MSTTVPRLRSAVRGSSPGLRLERSAWDLGHEVVVGVDEVGRGAWAGPLSVGAVVIPRNRRIYKVRDSKMLTPSERAVMHDRILDWSEHVSIGHASHEECDELGMSDAQRLAARRAIEGLGIEVDHVLVDGNWDFVEGYDTTTIVKGDTVSLSIAAASIVAKVTRDRIMAGWHDRYPAYSFVTNKGYPCPRHKAAIAALGPSTVHRRRWAFMDDLRWTGVPRADVDEEPQLGLF